MRRESVEELYGLLKEQEKRKESVLRDVRSFWERLFASLFLRRTSTALFATFALLCLVCPPCWPLALTSAAVLFWGRYLHLRRETLPMRLPAHANCLDPGLPRPGKLHTSFQKAAGIFYLGNEDGSDCELWLTREDLLTHLLCLGTTGAGKTETLVSLCFNYLALGSGFIYVDPKAAPRLAAQIWTMARMLGREDDFLLINYMADKAGLESLRTHHHLRTPLRQSNTQNPFAVGDANSLSQLLFALMPTSEHGSGQIFASNAQSLISGLLFVLVERRDLGLEALSIDVIRSYLMDLGKIDALARESRYSDTAILALQAGLATVGWDKSRSLEQQAKNFPEQYAYARAYFGRALSLLVDNYGRIFGPQLGEVDAIDVITNRRIFVSLIPSMDKDPKELKSLGQICLAQVRNACAVGLGDTVQGTLAEVLQALPTESKVPFGIIVDEYAAIETPGFEILLTQGRGLGMSVVVASQDFAGIRRSSEGAAEQIISNCKVKLFMATEDPRQTTDLAQKLAGKGFVLKSSGYSVNLRQSSAYQDNLSVHAESMQRVDFRDLQRQVEGQVTIAFRGDIIRGYTFFANPPLAAHQSVRLNYQLALAQPNLDYLLADVGCVKHLLEAFVKRGIRETRAKSDTAEPAAGTEGWENAEMRPFARTGCVASAEEEIRKSPCPQEREASEEQKTRRLFEALERILRRRDLGQMASSRAIVALWTVPDTEEQRAQPFLGDEPGEMGTKPSERDCRQKTPSASREETCDCACEAVAEEALEALDREICFGEAQCFLPTAGLGDTELCEQDARCEPQKTMREIQQKRRQAEGPRLLPEQRPLRDDDNASARAVGKTAYGKSTEKALGNQAKADSAHGTHAESREHANAYTWDRQERSRKNVAQELDDIVAGLCCNEKGVRKNA